MLHRPEGAPRGGIVCCYPLMDERKCAHRAFVLLSRRLAAEGFAVLRFDYAGCGDSEGDFTIVTLSGILGDIDTAVEFLKSRAHCDRAGLVGLRFGATAAALAAARRNDVPFLVLWQCVADGASYLKADLKRKLVREMMMRGKSKAKRSDMLAELEGGRGRVDLDGFIITGALYKELNGVDIAAAKELFGGDVLVMQISFNDKIRPETQRVFDAHQSAGANVTLSAVVEQPFWNRIDYVPCAEVIDKTVEWISSRE